MTDAPTSIDTILKVVEIVSILGGGGIVFFKMGRVTSRVETLLAQSAIEITALKLSVQSMGEVITKVAVQSERLDNQAKRIENTERHIDELRRGEGLITTFKAAKP